MKCLNPKCPNPTLVETFPVEHVKFCPACSCSLDPSLKSLEENKKSENEDQTEQEEEQTPSTGQEENELGSESTGKPESNSTHSCKVDDGNQASLSDAPDESVVTDDATVNKDNTVLNEDDKPSVASGEMAEGSVTDDSNADKNHTVLHDNNKFYEGQSTEEDNNKQRSLIKLGDSKEEDIKTNSNAIEATAEQKHRPSRSTSQEPVTADNEKGALNSTETSQSSLAFNPLDTTDNYNKGAQEDAEDGKETEEGKEKKVVTGEKPKEGKETKEKKQAKEGNEAKESKEAKEEKDLKKEIEGTYYRKPPIIDEQNKSNKQKSKKESTSNDENSNSDGNYMTIVLHALLAPHFQFDANKGDRVVVRGGTPQFNGWKKDQLEMTPTRVLPDDYTVLEGTTTIQLKHANRGINYKYLVIKKDESKEMWEELIDCQVRNKAYLNRCFFILEQYRKPKGVWHQYDDAIFSQPKLWESIRNKLPYLQAMNPYEGRELAVRAFLPEWDSFGVEETEGKRKGSEVLGTINQVVYCMENLEAENNGYSLYRNLNGFSLEEVLLSYIEPRLKKNLAHSTMSNEHIQANRLATSLAIAAVASNFIRSRSSFHPTQGHLEYMFECLALDPSLGRERLQRIMEILGQHYPRKNWMRFSGAISELCQYTINNYPNIHQWLLAVPIMHFFGDVSQPFTDIFPLTEPTPRDTSYWGTNGIDLTRIQSDSWRSPIGYLHRLKPMFDLDPMLRRTFLCTLPLSDLGPCVSQGGFLPHEVSWTLAHAQQKMHYYNREELTSITTCLDSMIDSVNLDLVGKENHESEGLYNSDEMISLTRGSLQVLEYLLIPRLQDVLNLVCRVLTLISKSLSLIMSAGLSISVNTTNGNLQVDQTENNDAFCVKILKEVTAKVQHRLNETFSRNPWSSSYRADEELEIWSAFLQVTFSDDALQTCWQVMLLEGLNTRINKLDDMQKIDLFSTVKLSHLHEEVEKCFQKAAFDAITRITEGGRDSEHARAFHSLSHHDPNVIQSKRVSQMMSLLLERCWPKGSEQEEILLNHVLTWSPMPNYLRYFHESSLTLTGDSQEYLVCTSSCLEDIHRMVSDASVTINILRILRDKKEKYCELITIIATNDSEQHEEEEEVESEETSEEESEKEPDLGENNENQPKTILQKRLDELEAFENELSQLRSFLRMSAILQHVDVEDLKAKAKEDVSQLAISDIAVHTCGFYGQAQQIQVIFFDISNELKYMIEKMHQIHRSKIFNDIWRRRFKDAQHGEQTMTLEEVVEQVWSPTFKKCKEILRAVLTGNIILGDVGKYFESFKDHYDDLVEDLRITMSACGSKDDIELIQTQVNLIEQFHRLTKCIAAAEKILEFAKEMVLEGDFQMVDTFRQQISPESKKQPLNSLGDEFSDIGKRLEEFTPERLACLDAVMTSKDFIEWLKEAVPDPSEIKVLVDLAMMSAGEGDMESDRIAALHTSTRAFKPLIYDLDVTVGFERLVELCKDVWDALKHNPRLPRQMTDTSRRLEWLKDVKEFHGSEAMSSLQQVETINKHGTLTIGCHSNGEEIDINTVISLKVPPEKVKGLQKGTYSLEGLKDLQSKLMLIAGKSTAKDDVEKFTEVLQGAIRLGTIYISLCETGEISHLNWKRDFQCGSRDMVKDLQENYDEFDEYLKAWTAILNQQRKKCKELNYFTAKQLLYLRKEIAELKRGREFASLDVQLYTLLDSVLPGVRTLSLQEALIAIGIDVDFPEEFQPSSEPDEEDENMNGDLRKIYNKFFQNVEELDYPEEVALAAIVACDCPREESDLLMWCIRYKQNEDLIQEMCDEGAQNPKYASLFPQENVPDIATAGQEEKMDLDRSEAEDDERNYVAKLDQTLDGLYLSLEELSTLLGRLADNYTQAHKNPLIFPSYLRPGKPNLLLVPQRDILATVLGLYMESKDLPSRHEVLICTQETTLEEVELLWRRALTNTDDKFYCLVNAHVLSYAVSQQAVQSLFDLIKEYDHDDDYKVAVICSSEQEVKSQMVSVLDQYRVGGAPRCPRPLEVTKYLQQQFLPPPTQTVTFQGHKIDWVPAAEVDRQNRLSVRVISSDRAGTGKSLVVKDYSKRLDDVTNNQATTSLLEDKDEHVTPYVIVPLHGKTANLSDTVSFLLPYSLQSDVPMSRIFHIDVSPSVEQGLDTLLFNLLLLGSVQDKRGRVWIRNPRDLYIVEMTSSHDNRQTASTEKYARSNHFYDELPGVSCMTPKKALEAMNKETATEGCMALFNESQFQSEAVQRVFQYLRLFEAAPEMLHEFQFDPELLAEGAAHCLCLLRTYCGVADPSWAELQHFVDFLNYQLNDCEHSVFCQMENVGDTLEGFRLFVVRFMIIMAQDFSTRSLSDPVASENDDDDMKYEEPQDIVQFQLRRKWESSPHPYMFFNPDHETFTFLGFRIDQDGNLINSSTGEIIQEHLMTRHLRTGLHVQRVAFDEEFEQLDKGDKITKICRVLGVEWPRDPDESYELTEDNAKKMLAIHMRFRCGIPVVVMGETGCGKTKLIRYLCGLQKGFDERKNMLLVKVHGGTTFQDIENKVKQAKEMAEENIKSNIETVLFFDEVNTTEALDLVKEIMVDGRLNGSPLGLEDYGLRFIAACNPYRKHTEDMIKKLESAGLGYTVKTEDTTERIGRVPLRHLVYRVHALPDSMRCLIWDFGQLKPEVELLYTKQIVMRHVLKEQRIPGDASLVDAITSVLAESQRYMREQSDECSFVSLRDVERTMNVMVWFYEHRNEFRPFLEQIAKEENNTTNEREETETESDDDDDDDDGDHDDDDDVDNDKDEAWEDSDSDEQTKNEVREYDDNDDIHEDIGDKPRRIPLLFSGFKSFLGKRHATPEPIPSTSGISLPASLPNFHSDDLVQTPFLSMTHDEDEDEDLRAKQVELAELSGLITVDDEEQDLDDPTKPIDAVTWSLILAIGVCYHAKLQERKQYRDVIAKTFKRPCVLYGGAERILQEITRCQKAVLRELDPGPNIARNTALSENVFMMVVCIELRIPLFVIGKPGSSKSLAKTVVADNMQGDASKSQLFKTFKEVQMSSHQCSPLSTPEGIQETFRQSAKMQKDKNPDKFASVVVLDEVGLAEDSPLMPLKTLHPLLEDGVTSSDDIIETDEKPTRVAFIGISNWALDPAKMNRGIMLSRDVPDEKELEDSAMGICASNKEVQECMQPIIPALAAAYSELYEQQKEIDVLKEANKDEFFGLRDFYSLIKMLYGIAEEKRGVPDWKDVEYAVRRNFGGLDVNELDAVEIFMKHLDVPRHVREEEKGLTKDVSSLNLIKSNLEKDPGEENSRYLLILTENHAALGIVEQHLKQIQHQNQDELDAVLIFGSSFPKDLEYTQVCRNINDIKVCMETGRTVILLNMESLYEGLYDALNQYYVEFGGNRYVDLGLGTHRVKCRVHDKFRLIVIAEKETVYKKFPIPLINRLEKHFLVLSTSLTPQQEQLVKVLREWVRRFSIMKIPGYKRNKKKFTEDDAFVGYHDDTIPSVVLQVCGELQEDGTTAHDDDKDQWEDRVLSESKRRLVQCCPPDAIARLHYSKLADEADQLWDLYFTQQQHSSLASFITSVDRRRQHEDGLLIQVSTHSNLLSEHNLDEVSQALNLHPQAVSCITLQQFQTEQQFCDCVGNFFAKRGGAECLLIVQCNTEDLTFNLLACARHHLLKQRSKITEEIHESAEPIHIIVIIQLPKMFGRYPNFVGFQGQRWESVHIDELFTPSFYVPSLENVKDQSLSDLFKASIDMCFEKTDKQEQVLDAVDVIRQSVQAAAGRIEDEQHTVARATKRIVILLNLLSKDSSEEHDVNSFSHVLIRRVHYLLKQKDASAPDEGHKWSTSEALESSELQESGTFRKALWHRIQNAVVPILSELIAYMDRDGNLELLQTDVPWLKQMWIDIFKDQELTELHYDSFLTNDDDRRVRSHVPVTSSGRDSHSFQCKLPFSWLLKEKTDSMWLQAKTVAENSHKSIEDCFRTIVTNSDVSDVVHVIEQRQEAMERYIHDFVHMNCTPLEDGEDELIARAVIVEARHQHVLSPLHDKDFLYPDIALVYKAYSHIEQRIACFSQLVQSQPAIVPKLVDIFLPNEYEMTLDVIALRICLESLEPLNMNFEDHGERSRWCDKVISVRATVERMFKKDKNEPENEEKRMGIIGVCRPLWERLTAVRLFIEHIYLSSSTNKRSKKKQLDPENIVKLCKVLDDKTDFSSASSIEAVELFLVECINSFKTSSANAANEFRRHCNSFFMELISLLCFSGQNHRNALDQEVFEIFMRYITGSSSSQATKNFSPFPDFEVDKTPVVRSFLLQQLLTISFENVKKYLQRYLSDAQALSPDRDHVVRVCQLAVDCIEDSNSSELSQREVPLKILIGLAVMMIAKGRDALESGSDTGTLDIEVLEAIARVRHVLKLTAELLFRSHVANDETLQETEVKPEFEKLLIVVEGMFLQMADRAPLVFLLKQLTRRYGGSVIKDLTQDPDMNWLIPREYKDRQIDASSGPDRFVVYNEEYMNIRDAVARGLLSGNVEDLATLAQVDDEAVMMNPNTKMKDVLCLLSIYREITCGYREPRQKLTEHDGLRTFFHENLSPEVRPLVTQLLDNSHGMGFTALSVQPAQPRATINLAELVVHTMVVLQCSNDNDVINTLRTLLMNPANMKDSYLPTMPEDDFQHVRLGLTENVKWYVCPEGHRYSIGDCGNANQQSVCPECKSGIGGMSYKLLPGNAPLTDPNEDRSSRRHILGNANMDQASSPIQPERNLSPAVVHIIRLVMHSAMLVGACRHPQESCQLFSPAVEPERLNEFLWAHLTRDLRSLAAALNRNEDEALLTVHLVLTQITRVTLRDFSFFPGSGVLDSSPARRQWEEDFTARFIEPVLSRLDEQLQTCFDVMTKDNRVGTDPLMREIYEVDNSETDEEELSPMNRCFWRYRAPITVEHAKQRFAEQMKSDKNIQQCKILQHFFKEEYRLRAVRYLPDVNKLHKLLTDRFYRRINQKQASEMTIKKFEASLKGAEKKEFKTLLGSFKEAWKMVRQYLDKQGRYKLSREQCSMSIDDTSSMSLLIPSTDGQGRCSMALVFYLVTANNEFMETYFNAVLGSARDVTTTRLPEVTCSQLVSYDADRDLLPLIHAHCHYSLEVGHGTTVEYDWPALQRQLVDRFIRGRNVVEFQQAPFVFLRNNDEEMFDAVRSKIKQESISPASASTIKGELRHLNDVCDVKHSLEIAMGFLASSGGRPDQFIREYLHDVLHMPSEKGLRSRRAEQHCKLKHIVHLWQLVTTQRAKILLREDQDPFEELQDCFKVDIPKQVLVHLNKFLRTTDCSKFCIELLEMITFSLTEEHEQHCDSSLKEFFEWHMERECEATDVTGMPDGLLLRHAVKTWQNVLEKSEEHQSRKR